MTDTPETEQQDSGQKAGEYDYVVRKMLENAISVDFPDAPKIGRDGEPAFHKVDEELCWHPSNDMGNAQRFIRRYGDDFRYVENIGWYAWTGTHWSPEDGDRLVERRCHDTAKAMKKELLALIAHGPRKNELVDDFNDRVGKFRRFANTCGNSSRLKAMRDEAQAYLTSRHDDFDKNPWLVTVENGTLNLDAQPDAEGHRQILLQKHNRKDMISKCMAVKYDPKAECVKFRTALADIQPDVDIQVFLQVYFGYVMTGSMKEQKVMMFWGGGSNGKSMLMGFFYKLFDSYAKGIPIASLMAQDKKSGSGASPDLARLPGARFVTSSEPEAGQRFSETFLKITTGEEAITTRHLNEGFFEFWPCFKLCISFNNKPPVRSADDGFWRRVLLVPFDQKFVKPEDLAANPGAKVGNPDLKNEIWDERSGVLNWMLDGYLIWREKGLTLPSKVKVAVDEYRSESNPILQFLQDWCIYGPHLEISATRLYDAYKTWAKQNGHDPCSMNFFGRKMNDNPHIKRRRSGMGNHYAGIDLSQQAADVMATPVLSEFQKRAEDDITL